MRVAVVSCWAYRDAWKPFFALLDHFWPDHPVPVWLITDSIQDHLDLPKTVGVFCGPGTHKWSWCESVAAFAQGDEQILLFQEDFFLTKPVQGESVQRALEFLDLPDVGCVRLCPTPGPDADCGDPEFGEVSHGMPYRISCQAALWRPDYLRRMAEVTGEPMHFELNGTALSHGMPDRVLSWKRELQPWPLDYICSAITRGRWDPNAKRLCDSLGIEADWTMRPFAA